MGGFLHLGAFLLGYWIDLLIGDPRGLWHPVQGIGSLISALEKRLYPKEGSGTAPESSEEVCGASVFSDVFFRRGMILSLLVLLITGGSVFLLLFALSAVSPVLLFIGETVMTWQILAGKSLRVETMQVCDALRNEDLPAARKAVSMVVSRDTAALDREGVIRAAVETVAENTSDGVTAPMMMLAAGGPLLGFLYKAASTMDSMLGYKNDRYLKFGRFAARLDDVLNFIPSRITALLMIVTAGFFPGEMDRERAYRIWKRDRRKHDSPNAAQTEAVMAGALGIRLAGPTPYFGKIKEKPYLGDPLREPEAEDIARANRLSGRTTALLAALLSAVMAAAAVRKMLSSRKK